MSPGQIEALKFQPKHEKETNFSKFLFGVSIIMGYHVYLIHEKQFYEDLQLRDKGSQPWNDLLGFHYWSFYASRLK